ncbi:MAG: Na/Pi cotransporter family protein [Ruminococcaceae bacterium]|nr:Na/Pi cotransporter family protein [Oscillospiraceae bacterium]
MTIANAIALLGGLGFFLFGMSLLGDGLKRVAGGKLESILGKLTSTTFKGVLLGSLVTAVIQSSSATTVMVVGFVNSGIMKLANAIGIIMGANIGTTATGWILVLADVEGSGLFSSATVFALISFIGIILFFFCKKNTPKNIGMIMMAFAVLMSGMQAMSSAMAPLKESEFFLKFISTVSNPVISIIVGIIVTAVIQSCSASIGILQALSITGVIGYDVAIPMTIGMCVGACVPVLLSAIGANVNGKRAAFIYLYFNLAGAAVLMIPFYTINSFADFGIMSLTATSMGIAIVNTVFKVLATVILAPMSGLFEKVAIATIKDKHIEDEVEFGNEDHLLDERFLEYPSVALEQSGKTLEAMTGSSFKNLRRSVELISRFNQEKYGKILSREDKVDRYEDVLGAYLVRLNVKELSEKETQTGGRYLNCLGNVERISDHAVNIAELAKELSDKEIRFSEKAEKELKICIDAVLEILSLTEKAMLEEDVESAKRVEPLEEVVDAITQKLKSLHVQRVQMGSCTLELGFIYSDCLNNLERVADHCSNIAVAVLESTDFHLQSHDYLRAIKQSDKAEYRVLFDGYAEKYCGALSDIE